MYESKDLSQSRGGLSEEFMYDLELQLSRQVHWKLAQEDQMHPVI